MAYEFWLKDEKGNIDLLLPVTPGAYNIDYGNTIETVNATAKGDVNIASHRRLINVSIEGFFPAHEYAFCNRITYPVSNPFDYVTLIKRWINEKKVIRLIIADATTTKINAQFYIENISYSESAETNGDINYTITLREFKAMNVQSYNKIAVAKSKNRPRPLSPPPKQKQIKTYKVVVGDSLMKISRKVYGDATKWQKIYNANKSVIGKNPNIIYPGQVYTIP